jgi:hypothetical protein
VFPSSFLFSAKISGLEKNINIKITQENTTKSSRLKKIFIKLHKYQDWKKIQIKQPHQTIKL